MRPVVLLLALALTCPRPAAAEAPGFEWRDRYTADLVVAGAGVLTLLGAGVAETLVDLDEPWTRWGDGGRAYVAHEAVPNAALAVWAAPALVIGLVDGLEPTVAGDTNQVFESTLGLVEAVAWSLAATEIAKLSVRRARPDYDDRVAAGGDRQDGALSFFSGHSSLSFSVATYFAYWLGGRFVWGAEAQRYTAGERVRAGVLQAVAIGGAAAIAASRVDDNRHHWDDVLVGSLVGAGVASLAYWRRFDGDGALRSAGVEPLATVSDRGVTLGVRGAF